MKEEGEGWEWPGEHSRSKEARRSIFLEAVEHYAPQALSDLGQVPFECYQEARQAIPAERLQWSYVKNADARHRPELLPLQRVLRPWGEKWNLTADWCYEQALRTMGEWCSYKGTGAVEEYTGRRWGNIGGYGVLLVSYPVKLEAVWQPTLDFLPGALATRKQVRDHLIRELDRQLDEAEADLVAQGLQPVPPKPARKGPPTRHYEWLALWQVGASTLSDIANRHQTRHGHAVGEDTISKGIDAAAEELGIERRTA